MLGASSHGTLSPGQRLVEKVQASDAVEELRLGKLESWEGSVVLPESKIELANVDDAP